MPALASVARAVTQHVHVPFGVYNLRPVTTTSLPGLGVFRSSLLWGATRADRRRLQRLGIRLVIDLRTEAIASILPDPRLPGVRQRHVDMHGTGTAVVGPRETSEDTMEAMRARYRRMVTDEGQRARIAEVLHLVAEEPGAVLFHCTDGKDRTGWIALLLQHVHGDAPERIRADYLASRDEVARMAGLRYRSDRVRGGRALAECNRPMNIVDESFLDAALAEVSSGYGDLDGYIGDGLGIDDVTLTRLRAKL